MNTVEIKEKLQAIIENTESLKNSYFWTPNRAKEWFDKKYSVGFFEFDLEGHHYTFELRVNCSRAHVYISRKYTVDSTKKDLRLVRKVLKLL